MNTPTNRREFMTKSLQLAVAASLGTLIINEQTSEVFAVSNNYYKKAFFYQKLNNKVVKCSICPNNCVVNPGKRGKCRVKENINGEFYTNVYSRPAIIQLDNVEKAPLFHYKPGLKMLSIATAGCNLSCKYCQNWQFALASPEQVKSFDLTPLQVVQKAKQSGCNSIGFFYTEPTVFYEYMYDTAIEAKKAGLKTIMVTAAYINPEPLKHIAAYIDAFTIGFKGFNEQYYNNVVGGSLEPVKTALKTLRGLNKHFELVTLIVPTLNDNMTEFKNMALWIKGNLGSDVPLHITRFVPEYKLQNLPATPINLMNTAWQTAKSQGLKYVYIDNLPGHEGQNTLCPKCKRNLVMRVGFKVIKNDIRNSKCPSCGSPIKGLW